MGRYCSCCGNTHNTSDQPICRQCGDDLPCLTPDWEFIPTDLTPDVTIKIVTTAKKPKENEDGRNP